MTSHCSTEICKHIIAYANESDANPCPICELAKIQKALSLIRHYHGIGGHWEQCNSCKSLRGEEHETDCLFAAIIDKDGKLITSELRLNHK